MTGAIIFFMVILFILILAIAIRGNEKENAKLKEQELNNELEAKRNQYVMSSTAKIDYNQFFESSWRDQSDLFAKYLADACEETIPTVTNILCEFNNDRKFVESEVAAFLYFMCRAFTRSTNLDDRSILIYWLGNSKKNDRDEDTYMNRELIYEDIYFGKPVRAYWDPSGHLVKNTTNPFIFGMIAMMDFIWEPHLKGSNLYDDYISQPITVKSYVDAMRFIEIYRNVSLEISLLTEVVSGAAKRLNLIK